MGDGDTEGVGDVAEPGEAGGPVVVGFVALDLLFGYAERVSELALGPSSSNARLDQHRRQLGQECRVSPEAYPDKTYRGFVAEMAPEANRQKGTLQVKVQIRDPDKFLTPELTAKVEFLKR